VLTLLLDDAQLGALYPAFLRTDEADRILSVGPAIVRHVKSARPGAFCFDIFDIGYDTPEHSQSWSGGLRDVVRVISREEKLEFIGCRLPQQNGNIYLLSVSHSRNAGVQEGRFTLADFAPGDIGIAHMVSLSLQRALLAEAQDLVAKLTSARDVAVGALQVQINLLNGVSHELRTPLSRILGCSEILAEAVGADSSHLALRIVEAAHQLERKIGNLIDYAALRAGRLEVEPATVRIDQITAGLGPLKAQADHKRLGFSITRGPGFPDTVTLPLKLFTRVLENLVENAILYSSSGAVVVELSRSAPDSLRVVVRDTGPGMPPDISTSRFKDFSGMGYGTANQDSGLGIGLPICWEIAKLLNGGIGILDAPPPGCAIWFQIPMKVP